MDCFSIIIVDHFSVDIYKNYLVHFHIITFINAGKSILYNLLGYFKIFILPSSKFPQFTWEKLEINIYQVVKYLDLLGYLKKIFLPSKYYYKFHKIYLGILKFYNNQVNGAKIILWYFKISK
ncbi:hypothetical protein HMPREF9709_00197 [Helcococcus kunzii ATCC 51366]|uniref:Uncharacterized protein n=1 Tax=Helcococcus kunzii ATCC 51366 TaxID=883114 RepID=H3NLI6_9FIRM|nr:hypothetical protein HMPREF9709_00197 [Helcococcus kunzii ATCC 51366]